MATNSSATNQQSSKRIMMMMTMTMLFFIMMNTPILQQQSCYGFLMVLSFPTTVPIPANKSYGSFRGGGVNNAGSTRNINWRSSLFRTSNIDNNNYNIRRPTKHRASFRLDVTPITTTALSMSTSSSSTSSSSPSSSNVVKLDYEALVKYAMAIMIQMSLISSLLFGLDQMGAYMKAHTTITTYRSPLLWFFPFLEVPFLPFEALVAKIPFLLNCVLFYGLALKSRIFNPLCNTRPKVQTLEVATSSSSSATPKDVATIFRRKMPKWTPPGFVFPIVWLLIIGPLRAVTTSMIYTQTKTYSLPILTYIFHLSIGDVWNTINNVERRFGVATTGVYIVWLTKAVTAYQYYRINQYAGSLLSLSLIWLSIASALVTATWKLNPNPITNQLEPLYPTIDTSATTSSITKFAWFTKNQK